MKPNKVKLLLWMTSDNSSCVFKSEKVNNQRRTDELQVTIEVKLTKPTE